eukprot:CAMPEP_0170813124 /NCGR_PEP_ID=MMETSP0733-20121128/36582_1 /TAXON_ID=186038 /ORGANISM="Fragilariopsis kerguelensis, Strain L26-C5" /LENGTH=70 /DNA_ID=CAMNT_0011170243 /DNA_START=33 /DNA_END=242 /DNA_ORIENTATION=+
MTLAKKDTDSNKMSKNSSNNHKDSLLSTPRLKTLPPSSPSTKGTSSSTSTTTNTATKRTAPDENNVEMAA